MFVIFAFEAQVFRVLKVNAIKPTHGWFCALQSILSSLGFHLKGRIARIVKRELLGKGGPRQLVSIRDYRVKADWTPLACEQALQGALASSLAG